MAHVAIPIKNLTYPDGATFDNAILDIFEAAGAWSDNEEYTYTGALHVDQEDPEAEAIKAKIIGGLRGLEVEGTLSHDEVNALLKILEENSWDMGFFVDTF
jgi:hypothetical protein